MLGIDTRAARATWTVLLILLTAELIWLARGALLVFVIALLLAYLLAPAVELAERWLPARWLYQVKLGLVFVMLLGGLGTVVFLLGSHVANEAKDLALRMPALVKSGGTWLDEPLPAPLEPYREQIRSFVEGHVQEVVPLLASFGKGVVSGASSLLYVILIPILSFFYLLEAPTFRERIRGFIGDDGRRTRVDGVLADIHLCLGAYMRAVLLLVIATFAAYSIYYEIAGVPYALLLAGAAALFEFVPVVGPLAGMVLSVSVALFSGYPHWGWMIVFLLVYRVFQDYVLSPWLLSSGVELHPLLVLFGVLVGETVAGVPGLFLSVPVMASMRVVYRHLL
ncbi:MAG: AI-2E family transporter [Acidobacteria bacterium]|nr:AI-2E family transporter [Acidobacteriota bacterium]